MTVLEVAGVVLFLCADAAVGYVFFRWMRRGKLG
jgi:hypothetical protein